MEAIKDILTNKIEFNDVVKVAFDSVDTDRSGLIDEEELRKVMTQISLYIETETPTKEDVRKCLEI